jgi:glycosyltransferase involved in cell wall biosynthesis
VYRHIRSGRGALKKQCANHLTTPIVKDPYFSIIITTHLRAFFLRRCLSSLKASTFTNYELIVVSDVFDASTLQVAGEMLNPNDTFLNRVGRYGPALSRNLGMQSARGQYVLFLDDDDAFLPNYLADVYNSTKQDPGYVLYTNPRIVEEDRTKPLDPPLRITDQSVAEVDFTSIYVKNFIQNHTAIFPYATLRGKLQEPCLSSLEDWDFLLNVANSAEFKYKNLRGPVTFKDFVNPGTRRGNSSDALGVKGLSDYMHIYKRWPAPNEALRLQRQQFLTQIGFTAPLEWL